MFSQLQYLYIYKHFPSAITISKRQILTCEPIRGFGLQMSAALLSRFDLVFILLDRADEEHDKRLSEHIMRTHALAAAHAQPPRSSSEAMSQRACDAGEAWNG